MIQAFIQARMSSTRLPNKVLKRVLDKSILAFLVERVKRAQHIDQIVILTSDQNEDDAIENEARHLNVKCFRGDLNNVLKRFYDASIEFPSQHIVRLTADCPLLDPCLLDKVIEHHLNTDSDYTSNCQSNSFPDGLDVEVFTAQSLKTSYKFADKPSELEHITQFIRNHPNNFIINEVCSPVDLSHHRWTVDEPSDFQLIEKILHFIYPRNPNFSYKDVLELFAQKPSLLQINQHFQRNEGLTISLLTDLNSGYE